MSYANIQSICRLSQTSLRMWLLLYQLIKLFVVRQVTKLRIIQVKLSGRKISSLSISQRIKKQVRHKLFDLRNTIILIQQFIKWTNKTSSHQKRLISIVFDNYLLAIMDAKNNTEHFNLDSCKEKIQKFSNKYKPRNHVGQLSIYFRSFDKFLSDGKLGFNGPIK